MIRAAPSASPGSRSACPRSPEVATTRTTRCPSAASIAMVPEVSRASSSGWAWKNTAVLTVLMRLTPFARCGCALSSTQA
ncbi:hypothetical protein ACFQX6_56765 [Streptosporangium lutulentum]